MSDSMRDKIAAVQREHRLGRRAAPHHAPASICGCGWPPVEADCTCTDHPEHVADAVIAELGLRMDTTCHIHDREGKQRCHRYVTEWETDD